MEEELKLLRALYRDALRYAYTPVVEHHQRKEKFYKTMSNYRVWLLRAGRPQSEHQLSPEKIQEHERKVKQLPGEDFDTTTPERSSNNE